MKNISRSLFLIACLVLALSCNLVSRFASVGTDTKRTSELWPDVPRMEGLAPSEVELPLAIKVIMRTVLNNLWRLNKEGEDKTPVSGDWIVLTSPGTPADVQKFYTNERMTSFGNWEKSKEPTCIDGNDKGIDGVLCVFQKTDGKKEIGLAMVAVQDKQAGRTNIFFLRLEQDAQDTTPGASNTPQPKRPITKLNGPAPYGIEKRPMPSGTDLDQLLPRQVGPYTRVILEKSEQRGVTPTAIDVDGNSVYATYRNGDKEVFVEFSIASTPEYAQSNWDVVVGDANEGIYPTDPKLGSFRTEPSYLKVSNDNGAFFAWTHDGYFITASAKGGEADLAAFMNAFPY